MAATLSLEPLLHALPPLAAGKTDKTEDQGQDSEATGEAQSKHSLAARLQRLWQERGDFSKLSVEALESEDKAEGHASEAEEAKKDVDHPTDMHEDGEDHDHTAVKAEAETSMTPEQLWELKLGILQGLDLARSDVTSALDLLQLLLNPVNALSPPVPEEALALPSGSMSSTSLHTPLPAPPEGVHVRNTALSLATKTKAIDTASSLLKKASKRLDRTTNKSQSEWTDLLRLKRSGQWKIEARAAQVSPQAGLSSAPFLPNIPIDKMARDICIFCGIEESAYRWRQAGLVRLDNTNNMDKGKGKEKLNIPERLEGRRRMCIQVKIDGIADERVSFSPTIPILHEDDMHSALVQVQQELFEEEIFAELIREARDNPAGITATRVSIEFQQAGVFTLLISMKDIEDLRADPDTMQGASSSTSPVLPQILLLLAHLQMIQIFARRRQRTAISPNKAAKQDPVCITQSLRQTLLYYRHSTQLKQLLQSCRDALDASRIFGQEVVLDFASCLGSPKSLMDMASSSHLSLGGTASLIMGLQSLNLTFSDSSTIIVHLPTRNVPIRNMQDFCVILKRILKAAILKQLESVLNALLKSEKGADTWEVIPTPKSVVKSTPALARKTAKAGLSKVDVEAFISILPAVAISSSHPYEVEIIHEARVSARQEGASARKTFSSATKDEMDLVDWLREGLRQV